MEPTLGKVGTLASQRRAFGPGGGGAPFSLRLIPFQTALSRSSEGPGDAARAGVLMLEAAGTLLGFLSLPSLPSGAKSVCLPCTTGADSEGCGAGPVIPGVTHRNPCFSFSWGRDCFQVLLLRPTTALKSYFNK